MVVQEARNDFYLDLLLKSSSFASNTFLVISLKLENEPILARPGKFEIASRRYATQSRGLE
jgi:hypothetical protein